MKGKVFNKILFLIFFTISIKAQDSINQCVIFRDGSKINYEKVRLDFLGRKIVCLDGENKIKYSKKEVAFAVVKNPITPFSISRYSELAFLKIKMNGGNVVEGKRKYEVLIRKGDNMLLKYNTSSYRGAYPNESPAMGGFSNNASYLYLVQGSNAKIVIHTNNFLEEFQKLFGAFEGVDELVKAHTHEKRKYMKKPLTFFIKVQRIYMNSMKRL